MPGTRQEAPTGPPSGALPSCRPALAGPTRAAFLAPACREDTARRARLEALLAAHEQPDPLLATQAKPARATLKLDLADAPEEAVGQQLGRYQLLERVGAGGCGVVYVAGQTEPVRRRVALKALKPARQSGRYYGTR